MAQQLETASIVERPEIDRVALNWLSNSQAQHLLVLGPPGTGKSTWIQSHAKRLGVFSGSLVAYHFCHARDLSSISPFRFLENVCLQIAKGSSAFAKALVE